MDCQEDCFHLGVKALIHDEMGRVLLLQLNPAKLNSLGRIYWELPGGRIHKSESLEDALRREVCEETGLQNITNMRPFSMALTNIRIPMQKGDVGLIFKVYLCEVADYSNVRLSNDHIHFDWFEPSKAAELLATDYPTELIQKIKVLNH